MKVSVENRLVGRPKQLNSTSKDDYLIYYKHMMNDTSEIGQAAQEASDCLQYRGDKCQSLSATAKGTVFIHITVTILKCIKFRIEIDC